MTDNASNLGEIFRKTLNSHGYGFQYRAIREAQRLNEEGKSEWVFEVSEFPVSVRGKNTHIDLILRKRNTRYHLIGECKRANPALANWCFVRSPYVRRNRTLQKLFFQFALLDSSGNVATGVDTDNSDKIYNIGLEVPSPMKGDAQGQGRKVIEDAVTQVTVGVNGMIDFLPAHRSFAPPQEKIHLIPVIFTTANLWTSEMDLGSASLETGELAPSLLEPASWIWLQHHQSPTIKHSMTLEVPVFKSDRLGDILEHDFSRSIAIVSAAGIEQFLSSEWF